MRLPWFAARRRSRPDNPEVAESLTGVASVLQYTGDYPGAEFALAVYENAGVGDQKTRKPSSWNLWLMALIPSQYCVWKLAYSPPTRTKSVAFQKRIPSKNQ
jgi:hypothetical protein